jgi:hypothetical protein
MLKRIVTAYTTFLPPFLVNSVFSSYILGLNARSSGPMETFEHMISYTTLGLAVGFLYPVSYPICAGYTFYKLSKPE